MLVRRLDLHRFRRFDAIQLQPGPRLNVLTGVNGAGKTSVLEALHLMAYGRSFRGRPGEGLIQAGGSDLEVFVEWEAADRTRRAGLRHSGKEWTGRLDGETTQSLTALCAALAVVTFEPGSHQLVMGPAEGRRRFLDWGMFHVEPRFMPVWRRYNRALKQRNSLLKQGLGGAQLDAWDIELASSGVELTEYRHRYLRDLEPHILLLGSQLAPTLNIQGLTYQYGWRADSLSLADALLLNRDRDRQSGFTGVGPHRADWRLDFATLEGREHLSRGQAKLSALSILLGQAAHMAATLQEWPVIALDDLASELDQNHQRLVLDWLRQTPAQVFVTGTDLPVALADWPSQDLTTFHVEQLTKN